MNIKHGCEGWGLTPAEQECVMVLRTAAVGETAVVACSFTPCGQVLATGSTYGDLRLWDLYLNQLHVVKNAHDLGVACCHFAPQVQSGEYSAESSTLCFRFSDLYTLVLTLVRLTYLEEIPLCY